MPDTERSGGAGSRWSAPGPHLPGGSAALALAALALLVAGCGFQRSPDITSGGLGLTRAAWESIHHLDSSDVPDATTLSYDGHTYEVRYWADYPAARAGPEARICYLAHGPLPRAGISVVLAEARALLPPDAEILDEHQWIDAHTWTGRSAALSPIYSVLPSGARPWESTSDYCCPCTTGDLHRTVPLTPGTFGFGVGPALAENWLAVSTGFDPPIPTCTPEPSPAPPD